MTVIILLIHLDLLKRCIHTHLVANSTPIVLLLSRLNSFLVNLDSKLLFPTPESPISTTERIEVIRFIN